MSSDYPRVHLVQAVTARTQIGLKCEPEQKMCMTQKNTVSPPFIDDNTEAGGGETI